MDTSAIIDKLGGTKAVATELTQNDSTISMWRQRGVPWRWRQSIAAMAARKDVALPEGFLSPTGIAA